MAMRPAQSGVHGKTLDPSKYLLRNTGGSPTDKLDESEKKFLVYDQESEYYKCTLCMTLHGDVEQYMWHARGKRHLKNVSWKEYEDLDNDPSLSRMGDPNRGVPPEIECRGTTWFRCHACDVKVYDLVTVDTHCKSRRHLSQVMKPNLYRPSTVSSVAFRPPAPQLPLAHERPLRANPSPQPDFSRISECPKPPALLYGSRRENEGIPKLANDSSGSKLRLIPPPPNYDPRIGMNKAPLKQLNI